MKELNICTLVIMSNQPTSLKVKNVHNLAIFQPICLKLGMLTQNGRIQHMFDLYALSMLAGQTSLPPNQPTGPKVKNLPNLDIFPPI